MPSPASMVKLMKALGLKTDDLIRASDPQAVEAINAKLSRKGGKPTEQDVFQEIARLNAAMPVQQGGLGMGVRNTAQERAKKLGYESGSYHGTRKPDGIKGLIAGGTKDSYLSGDAYGLGVYTSTSPSTASVYAGDTGAVMPLMINRSGHLNLASPSDKDLSVLTEFASKNMLPSDKARFSSGLEKRTFTPDQIEDAKDFFRNQQANAEQFGQGYERTKPWIEKDDSGNFVINYTNFDANVPIRSGEEAETMLRALGYDSVANMGYSGHTMPRSGSEKWDVTFDPSRIRSRFAAFDPARVNENNLLASRLLPFALPGLLALPTDEE